MCPLNARAKHTNDVNPEKLAQKSSLDAGDIAGNAAMSPEQTTIPETLRVAMCVT